MLMDVLEEISKEEHNRLSDLAKKFGIGRELLEQILWDLSQRGYLEKPAMKNSHCGACGKKSSESVDCSKMTWRLTAKGRRALEKRV
mgnify:CR=1 FL=1